MIGGIDLDIAGNIEICTRRAVEITRKRCDFDSLAKARRHRLRRQGQFEAFRHIVFDEEARLPNRGCLRVRKGLDAPGSRRNAGEQRQRKAAAAIPLILGQDPLIFDAIGTFDNECERRGSHTRALPIAE